MGRAPPPAHEPGKTTVVSIRARKHCQTGLGRTRVGAEDPDTLATAEIDVVTVPCYVEVCELEAELIDASGARVVFAPGGNAVSNDGAVYGHDGIANCNDRDGGDGHDE
jgi:hypothetical protein